MRYGTSGNGGRHRAPETEAPARPRSRRAHRPTDPASEPRTSNAPRSRAATRAERKRRRTALASIASVGLVSSFFLALPANAAVPYEFVGSAFPDSIDGQSLAVSTEATVPTVQRSTYGQIGSSVTEVASVPAGLTNNDWAQVVLEDGGFPVTANNLTVVLQWMDSENSPEGWWNRNNPLNNGWGSGGGAGFGSYSNLLIAAEDVAVALHHNSGYAQIVADLTASAPTATTAVAIEDSPWAGSHYDYGAIWHAVSVPTVSAPASAW